MKQTNQTQNNDYNSKLKDIQKKELQYDFKINPQTSSYKDLRRKEDMENIERKNFYNKAKANHSANNFPQFQNFLPKKVFAKKIGNEQLVNEQITGNENEPIMKKNVNDKVAKNTEYSDYDDDRHHCVRDPLMCLANAFAENEERINMSSKKKRFNKIFDDENNSKKQYQEERTDSAYKKGDKKFKCTSGNCNKTFTSLFGLRYHTNNGHNNKDERDKPFCCDIMGCNRRYKNSNGLKYHERTAH